MKYTHKYIVLSVALSALTLVGCGQKPAPETEVSGQNVVVTETIPETTTPEIQTQKKTETPTKQEIKPEQTKNENPVNIFISFE